VADVLGTKGPGGKTQPSYTASGAVYDNPRAGLQAESLTGASLGGEGLGKGKCA
jgi:hypothetical protein